MSLRERQSEFAALVPRLIDKAIELGYQVTLGDAFRDWRVHGSIGTKMGYGHSKSVHKVRPELIPQRCVHGRHRRTQRTR